MNISVNHIRQFLLVGVFALVTVLGQAQEIKPAYQKGEWFKFRVHYGLITAGYATLTVEDSKYKEKPVYHVKGFGETVGLSKFFFKVEDYYESYIDKETDLPYQFVRKIDEGGHTKDKIIDFDQENQKAHVFNRKHNTKQTIDTKGDVQDMVSSFYYLRNHIDASKLKENDETSLTMFFDQENFPFKLRFVGREVMNTKFGKIRCLKFKALVQSGRVFEDEESLTVWVSDDNNKVPIRIKANILVGSIKADLLEYKGLKHPFQIVVDN